MYYVDGTWVEPDQAAIQPEDRGYQFGDGIYEVVRIYKGKLYHWEGHLERLVRSAKELSLQLPYTLDEFTEIAQNLITRNHLDDLTDAILYMQITRGVAPRQFEFPNAGVRPIVTAYVRKKDRPLAKMQTGLSVITYADIRWLRCDIKSLNLLGAVLAKQEAVTQGVDDAILHRNGIVMEGSSSNLFVVKDGQLHTHPATNLILHGITRKTVIGLAQNLNISVVEEPFDLEFLRRADEVFFTSTTQEVMPIISIDNKPVGAGQPGPITGRLQQAFANDILTVCSLV